MSLHRIFTLMLTVIMALVAVVPVQSQSATPAPDSPPVPQRVEVTAPDGLTLIGDFYAADAEQDEELPAVILLHGYTGNRHDWEPLIPDLLAGGYHVLTVDQRAHGETGGDSDLIATTDDMQVWFDWLRDQPGVNDRAISTIGASRGTIPAVVGCADDPLCVTAIAVSPGDFPTFNEETFAALEDRSVLFIVGRQDVLYQTRLIYDRVQGEAALYIYNTGSHGNAFFSARNRFKARATALVLNWLDEHTTLALESVPAEETAS